MEFVEVDGSQGEGGGQILRTAVAFSVILHKPVRVVKIRAGRGVPGLKRQHVSALEVLAQVFGGELRGSTEGSSEVTFVPGVPRLDNLSVDMGTAASITLVLQAVVPAVALTRSRLSLDLVGGTDVPWSPTFDYLLQNVREAYRSIGIRFEVAATRRGYYPRGGGRVRTVIEPCESVVSLDLTREPTVSGLRVTSRCGKLPEGVAERQLSSAAETLKGSGFPLRESHASQEQADSPGSSILVSFVGDGAFLGCDALGSRGKPAEEVGREAASKFIAAAKSGACIDSNLADMLLPLLSLAAKPSRVRVPEVTPHLESGLSLATQFTACKWSVEAGHGSAVVNIMPRPNG